MKYTDTRPRQVPPLSSPEPVCLVDEHGRRVEHPVFTAPDHAELADLHRAMVIGRRFNQQADALALQGRLAAYPSSTGQEAAQVGGVLALSEQDWLFPSHRDSVALVTRGVDPVSALTLFRGDRHGGYDPHHRCAPQCTPSATNAPHAVGFTYTAHRKGHDVAALALMGDGVTSGGDVHEAYGFAAVWNAPVVFLVQNSHWATSVPLRGQSTAHTPEQRPAGRGMRGYHVDGNDAVAVYAVVSRALAEARAGKGPAVVEAVTYRMDPGTGFGAPQDHREESEVDRWRRRDPLVRTETLLREEGVLGGAEETDRALTAFGADAEEIAVTMRERIAGEGVPGPDSPAAGA